MARSLALIPLFAFSALLVLFALPAAATTQTSSPTPVTVQLLCFDDCSRLPPTPNLPGGVPFDFDRGLKAVVDGADLTIQTQGNVFVYGPLNANDSIYLRGSNITVLDADFDAPNITLDAGSGELKIPSIIEFPGLIVPRLEDLPICGCITVGTTLVGQPPPSGSIEAEGGAIRIGPGGGIVIAQPVFGHVVAQAVVPGLSITPEGDVYVDVSMVTLGRFKVLAGGSIVVAGATAMPVPEPGTALLLGLGLAGLATRRADRNRGRSAESRR